MTSEVARLKAANPDLIFGASYIMDGILIARTLKSARWKPKMYIMMCAPDETEFLKALGADANGLVANTPWVPSANTPGNKGFMERWNKKFGTEIVPCLNETGGYGPLYVLYDALERAASTDPEKIRDALVTTRITADSGMSARALLHAYENSVLSFDEKGQAPFIPLTYQLQNEERVVIGPEEFASGKLQYPY